MEHVAPVSARLVCPPGWNGLAPTLRLVSEMFSTDVTVEHSELVDSAVLVVGGLWETGHFAFRADLSSVPNLTVRFITPEIHLVIACEANGSAEAVAQSFSEQFGAIKILHVVMDSKRPTVVIAASYTPLNWRNVVAEWGSQHGLPVRFASNSDHPLLACLEVLRHET